MKKVLAIGHNYYPELTGIGKYTSEFCSYLVTKGYETDVITGHPYYPQWKVFEGYKNNSFTKETIKGVQVYRTPLYVPRNPTGFKRLFQDSLFVICVWLMINYLLLFHSKKYDIIFIAVPSFMLGVVGLYYRFFSRRTKLLYHIQDLQIDAAENLGLIKSKVLVKALFGIERYIINRANHVSTISEGMKERVLQKSSQLKNCILFPNWVNSSSIFPMFSKPVISSEILKDKKIIFYSGAIGEKQGLEIILEAAEYFRNKEEIVFVISGEGPYKQKLIADCEQKGLTNLIFFELLPMEEFNTLLNASFLHLVIQKENGSDLFLPSKLTNILGVGGCVIVTANANTSLYNIIHSHCCGYLIPPSDSYSLCKGIEALDRDGGQRKLLSDNALNYAKKFLYQENVIERYTKEVGL